jgi:hypothetical protein
VDRKTVNSSELASIGYDPVSQVLEVEFATGGVYQYREVPAGVHSALMNAASHGKYFNQYVKKGGYAFIRIV